MPSAPVDAEFSLRQAMDYIPQGIAVFDGGLRLVTSNRRYNVLLSLPEGLTQPGTPLFDIALFLGERGDLGIGDAARLAIERINSLTASPSTVTQRLGNVGQMLEFHSSRLPDGGLIVSFSDVTARVKAERELERVNQSLEGRVEERTAALTRVNSELETARAKADAANHDKTRFLAAASHDLLQPLNAARLYTSTLIERAKSTSLAELANSIEASLTAVEDIMSALLDISRIDSGALRPAPAPVNAQDLLKKIEVEFAPMAKERSIALRDRGLARHGDRRPDAGGPDRAEPGVQRHQIYAPGAARCWSGCGGVAAACGSMSSTPASASTATSTSWSSPNSRGSNAARAWRRDWGWGCRSCSGW